MQVLPILKANGLHVTATRVHLLEIFLHAKTPLQLHDLLILNSDFNRTTLYRVLRTFVEAGILRVVPSKDGKIFYKLSKSKSQGSIHQHFICEDCHSILELEHEHTTVVPLPEGFQMYSLEIMVNGKCRACLQSSNNY